MSNMGVCLQWKIFVFNDKLWILRIIDCVHSSNFILWQILTKFKQNVYFKNISVKFENDIWIPLNTLKGSRTYYLLGKYLATIDYCNQKNNSCEMEQIDFKIFEFQLWLISWKILIPMILRKIHKNYIFLVTLIN
jgi:hypothetical protein